MLYVYNRKLCQCTRKTCCKEVNMLFVHSDRFKSPYRNITAKSKAANPKLQLNNQSFLSNNNTNVLIPSHAKKSTSNSIGNLIT